MKKTCVHKADDHTFCNFVFLHKTLEKYSSQNWTSERIIWNMPPHFITFMRKVPVILALIYHIICDVKYLNVKSLDRLTGVSFKQSYKHILLRSRWAVRSQLHSNKHCLYLHKYDTFQSLVGHYSLFRDTSDEIRG